MCEKWYNYQYCLERVKADGWSIRYVAEQTPKLCRIAIEKSPMNIVFIRRQDDELCKEAVRRDPTTIIYIRELTPEICIEAIRNGLPKRDLIKMEWTDEMEKEWVIKNV